MTPGVVADHVPVREHLPLDGAVRIVSRDVLADLEEGRGHVQPCQLADEVCRRRLVPRPVVECQRDVVDLARAREHPVRPGWNAADQARSVQPQNGRRRGEQRRTSRAAGGGRGATPRARATDHLPAQRAIPQPNARREEARRQLPVARTRYGRGDRDGRTRPDLRNRRIQHRGRGRSVPRPREAQLTSDRLIRRPLDQQAQRLAVPPKSAGRERLGELNLPDEILADLSQGGCLYAQRLDGRATGPGGGRQHHQRHHHHAHQAPNDPHPTLPTPLNPSPPNRSPYTPPPCPRAPSA